jgi:hypothetical protein
VAVFFVIYGFIFVTAFKYARQYAILHPADGPQPEEKALPEAINGEERHAAKAGGPEARTGEQTSQSKHT